MWRRETAPSPKSQPLSLAPLYSDRRRRGTATSLVRRITVTPRQSMRSRLLTDGACSLTYFESLQPGQLARKLAGWLAGGQTGRQACGQPGTQASGANGRANVWGDKDDGLCFHLHDMSSSGTLPCNGILSIFVVFLHLVGLLPPEAGGRRRENESCLSQAQGDPCGNSSKEPSNRSHRCPVKRNAFS